MDRVSFGKVLKEYDIAWEQIHRWGKILRSPNLIDLVRLLHIILLGRISSEIVDMHYIELEFEKRYGKVDYLGDILNIALREELVSKNRGQYELTLHGRLFLFIFADIVVEVSAFYRTPPTGREIVHILRLLSMIRVYEEEGFITENIGLLTTALSNIRRSAKFALSVESQLYERLVSEYESIKQLASKVAGDEDFTKALTALASIIDTELTFIREHLQEIKHLRRKSYLLLQASSDDIEKMRDRLLEDPEQYFKFELMPVAGRFVPITYIRRYSSPVGVEEELRVEKAVDDVGYTVFPIPSADEIFQVLFAYYQEKGELPPMGEDTWWLDKLSVYKEVYDEFKDDYGYKRALKARKVMALSMFLSAAVSDSGMRQSIEEKGREYFERAYAEALG